MLGVRISVAPIAQIGVTHVIDEDEDNVGVSPARDVDHRRRLRRRTSCGERQSKMKSSG